MLIGQVLTTATIAIEDDRIGILQNLRITGPVLLEVNRGLYDLSHVLVELFREEETASAMLVRPITVAAFARHEYDLLLALRARPGRVRFVPKQRGTGEREEKDSEKGTKGSFHQFGRS
jgi:hypothetical protein